MPHCSASPNLRRSDTPKHRARDLRASVDETDAGRERPSSAAGPAGKTTCPESRYAGPVGCNCWFGSSYQIDTVIEDGSKLPPLADW